MEGGKKKITTFIRRALKKPVVQEFKIVVASEGKECRRASVKTQTGGHQSVADTDSRSAFKGRNLEYFQPQGRARLRVTNWMTQGNSTKGNAKRDAAPAICAPSVNAAFCREVQQYPRPQSRQLIHPLWPVIRENSCEITHISSAQAEHE